MIKEIETMQPNPTTESRPSSAPRLAGVDALRGIAAVWVMIYHYTWAFDYLEDGLASKPLVVISSGTLAVYLFFMISGFVITMTIERRSSVVDFAFARWARLYPVYWAVIGLNVVYALILPGWLCKDCPTGIAQVLANLTMLQPQLGYKHIDGVFWSLSVEILFYVVVAGCLLVNRARWLLPVMLGLSVLDLAAYLGDFREQLRGWWRIDQGFPLIHFAHFFALGIAFYEKHRGRPYWLIPAGIVCLINSLLHRPLLDVAYLVVLAVSLDLCISGHCKFLEHHVLVWLGTISYSLYLIHENLGYLLLRFGKREGWDVNATIIGAMALSVAVATVFTFLIERPAHELLRRWWRNQMASRSR